MPSVRGHRDFPDQAGLPQGAEYSEAHAEHYLQGDAIEPRRLVIRTTIISPEAQSSFTVANSGWRSRVSINVWTFGACASGQLG
jgi:hypothetical protein